LVAGIDALQLREGDMTSPRLCHHLGRARPALAILLLLAICFGYTTPAYTAPVVGEHSRFADPEALPTVAGSLSLRATPAFAGTYRVGSWVPVLIEVANAGTDRQVQVQVGAFGATRYAVDVELPGLAQKALVVYAYLPTATRRVYVSLWSDDVELAGQRVDLEPVEPRTRMVGVVTQGPPLRLPPSFAGDAAIHTLVLQPDELPDHALGLSSFTTLIFNDPPEGALTPLQSDAIRGWVARGGQVLIGGAGAAASLELLPAPLQIAEVAGVETVAADTVITGAATTVDLPLTQYRLRPDPSGRLPYAVPLIAVSDMATPLWEQRYGNGRITLSGVSLSHPVLQDSLIVSGVWDDLLRVDPPPPAMTPNDLGRDVLVEGGIASTLASLPALELPPIGSLLVLIAIYIVTVGPLTYLVLRRLDRQSLGWVVVPVLTLLFAGATFSIGYAQRGGDVLINQIALVEPLQADPATARIRSFFGLFSPTHAAYTILVRNDDATEPPILRPASLLGPWDVTANGDGIFVQTSDSVPQVRDLQVEQWSMRAAGVDQIGSAPPISATLIFDDDRLLASVHNHGDAPFAGVVVVQGDRLARFGDLAPGVQATLPLERRTDVWPGVSLGYLVYGEAGMPGQGGGAWQLAPVDQVRMRILDALSGSGQAQPIQSPLLLAWSNTAGLATTVDAVRVEVQSQTLLLAEPQLVAGGGVIELDSDWFSHSVRGRAANLCYGSDGFGLIPTSMPVELVLTVPRDLYDLQPEAMTLFISAEGPWPQQLKVEAYDFAMRDWIRLAATGGALAIESPQRLFGSDGSIHMRLQMPDTMQAGACVFVDLRIVGRLP
jgi:hypothetical protein